MKKVTSSCNQRSRLFNINEIDQRTFLPKWNNIAFICLLNPLAVDYLPISMPKIQKVADFRGQNQKVIPGTLIVSIKNITNLL